MELKIVYKTRLQKESYNYDHVVIAFKNYTLEYIFNQINFFNNNKIRSIIITQRKLRKGYGKDLKSFEFNKEINNNLLMIIIENKKYIIEPKNLIEKLKNDLMEKTVRIKIVKREEKILNNKKIEEIIKSE